MASTVSEDNLIALLKAAEVSAEQAQVFWELFADQRHISLARPALISALVKSSSSPAARAVMWSELAGLARSTRRPATSWRDRSGPGKTGGTDLIDVFEAHRAVLRPLLGELKERDAAADDIIEVMRRSLVFGASVDEAVAYVAYRKPAAVAQHMERERGLGQPPVWEWAAFNSILRWKRDNLLGAGAKRVRTPAEIDAIGRDYIVVFNCLHWFDEGHRDVMLADLDSETLFNAVVSGEKELYRLGTSSYRNFLHDAILSGVRKSGSFEAFVERATKRQFGAEAVDAKQRGMVFLRVAAAFGLLDSVLGTVSNRERFVAATIASVEDPRAFELNGAIVLDVLLAESASPAVVEFKRQLAQNLYEHYALETRPLERAIYGSVLSVYQTATAGAERDSRIDRAFPIDDAAFRVPFERLFVDVAGTRRVHRVFARFDRNEEDAGLYADFRTRMKARGAVVTNHGDFDVLRLDGGGRTVEIYANRPSSAGLRRGIAGIANALTGKRVGTVIGRGHTSIIAPLQTDAKLVLGDRVRDVAAVIAGTCGGDASVRELIATFGYIPLVTTAGTGRSVINNAIEAHYIDALMSVQPGQAVVVADVVDKALAPLRRAGANDGLRSDARFYHVNMASVQFARLFDTHVRPLIADLKTASGE